jgi:hypothetical protein
MVIICTQPAIDFYAWQVDIFLASIKLLEHPYKDVHIVFSNSSTPSKKCQELKNKYPDVTFAFYNDERTYTGYLPSIKQHLMYLHFKANKWLEKESIFHVDSDVAFTAPIDFNKLLKDNIWYTSDTVSYIGYEYIKSKGDDILGTMLSIAEVDDELIKYNQNNSGGAQYLFKGVSTEYWNEVVELSHKFYITISALNDIKVKKDPKYHPLQIWTAEMWAVLWAAWKKGITTKVVPELDFCWATDPAKKWNEVSIFHNAGVVDSNSGMFYKGDYITNSPKDSNLTIDSNRASYHYYNLLKEVL